MANDVSIGSLTIDIVSSSDKAVESLTRLKDALSLMKGAFNFKPTALKETANAMKSFDSKRVVGATQNLKALSESLRSLADSGSNRGIFVLQSLKDVFAGFKSPKNMGQGIEGLNKALNDMPTESIDKLRSILAEFKNLQGVSGDAVAGIMKGLRSTGSGNALRKQIEDQQRATRESVEAWRNAVQTPRLALPAPTTQLALPPGRGMTRMESATAKGVAAANLGRADGVIEQASRFREVFDKLPALSTSVQQFAMQAGRHFESMRQPIQSVTSLTEQFDNAINKAASSATQSSSTISNAVKSMSVSSAVPASAPVNTGSSRAVAEIENVRAERSTESVNRLREALRSVGNHALTAGRKVLQFAANASGISMIKKAGDAIGGFKSKISGLIDSFKRIMLYRSIRSIIKAVASGFEEGSQNLYKWSKALDGDFAKSMDGAASSLLYFKNSVAAAAAPLVNAIVPVLQAIIRAAVAAVEAINRLFAMITGASYWTRAKEYATEYEESLSGAGGAAKELAKYLAPFDELNVLPSDPGGGGGGGGNSLNYNDMFEKVEPVRPETLLEIFDVFETAWNTRGKPMLETIEGAWNSIKSLMGSIAISFAEVFTNGSGLDMLTSIFGIVENIASFIGGLAESFKRAWEEGGRGTKLLQNLSDIANRIASYFETVTAKLAQWSQELDFGPLLDSLNGFLEEVQPVIEPVLQLFEELWDVLLDVSKWTIEDIAPASVDLLTEALGLLGDAISPLSEKIDGLWSKKIKPFAENIKNILVKALEEATQAIKDLREALSILSGETDIGKEKVEIFGVSMDELKRKVEPVTTAIDSLWKKFEPVVKWIGETGTKLVGEFKEGFSNMASEVSKHSGSLASAFNNIKGTIATVVELSKKNLNTFYNWFAQIIRQVSGWLEEHGIAFRDTFDTITKAAGTVLNFFIDFTSESGKYIGQFVGVVIEAFEKVTGFIYGVVSYDYEGAFGTIKSAFERWFVKPITDGIDKIKQFWEDLKKLIGEGISFPKIKTPHFSVTSEYNKLLGQSLPKINVSWYAKGGIVDGPTLIGAGEAGKEAIVPLEQNTGWIRNVAAELNGYNQTAPDDTANAVDEMNAAVVGAIVDIGTQIIEEISKNSGGISLTQLTKRVTNEQMRLARATGR